MKRKHVFWILPVFLLALGLVLAGCGDSAGGNENLTKFEGSWSSEQGEYIFTANAWEFVSPYCGKGTFKFTDTELILTITHPGINNEGTITWYTLSEWNELYSDQAFMQINEETESYRYEITGNTLKIWETLDDPMQIYTKNN
jgi:hypothetical protein